MNATHSTAELLLAVLPITAVETITFAGKNILVAGNGSHLRAIDVEFQNVLCNFQVLLRQAIHGIVLISSSEGDEKATFDFMVYGGRQIAWVVLDIAFHEEVLKCTSANVVDRITVKDWILSGKRSGSSEFLASFITSHNALYHVEAKRLTRQLHCWLLTDAAGVFLYSANLTQRCDNSYLIASGTVFGQVLVWSCTFDGHHQKWDISRLAQLNGHHGSIFGVNISTPHLVDGKERVRIVSCSDDRMIQVWDLPEIESDTPEPDIVVSDNFKQYDQAIAKTYGHISRIWNVDFITNLHENSLVVSTGEDGQVISWLLGMQRRTENQLPYLRNAYIDRHHAGKHIWSRCHSKHENETTFYTGGADGQIVSRRYDHTGRADMGSKYGSQAFKAVQSMVNEQTATRKRPLALKTYIALDSDNILATTDDGQLLRGKMVSEPITWETRAQDMKHTPLSVSTITVSGHAFFIRTSDSTLCTVKYLHLQLIEICSVRQAKVANIWAMNTSTHNADEHFEACIAISYHGHEDVELYWIEMSQGKLHKVDKSSVALPTTFEVTSMLYDKDLQVLVYGSRAGAIALSTNIAPTTANETITVCNRRVHAQDTVTSICKLAGDSHHQQSFYLSTGRDGTYSIHKLDFDDSQTPRLRLAHQASPLVGPSIEGANIVRQLDGSQVILLHGFHSKNFVVWNETFQTQVMSVDCGGAHRSWMFSPDKAIGKGGVFVWTKAGNFMFCDQKTSDYEIIQAGGHGREIKALATHQQGQYRWLLATGSEDTDVRLFEYDNHSSGESRFKNIATIRKHTTGLQDLQFSSDGKILISAAGMEELYAWSLTNVPVIGQGVVFACALASTDAQSDARIMSFDTRIQHRDTKDQACSYLIVAAYSNGRFKTIQLNPESETTKAHFTLLHQLDFGTICLTQAYLSPISFQASQSNNAIIGATNGFIGISSISPSNYASDTKTLSPAHPDTLTAPFHHKLHQNSITALQVYHLTPTHQLLVTGGDDNALAITIIAAVSDSSTSDLSDTENQHTFKSLLIPDAHAAAVTALSIIPHPRSQAHHDPHPSQSTTISVLYPDSSSNQPQHFTILSAGNDQRLNLWTVKVNISHLQCDTPMSQTMDEVEVQWVDEYHTDVADISGINVLAGSQEGEGDRLDTVEVVIVGVGMEIIRVRLDGSGKAESTRRVAD